ncbi:hypothetical protein WMF26_29065 [Sorangium sp. So ce185]|uniref:hypothetical protein n=1 Tax=Sorangium sp. So ce185 TaxID=3133287 RepID=UPI003F6367B4
MRQRAHRQRRARERVERGVGPTEHARRRHRSSGARARRIERLPFPRMELHDKRAPARFSRIAGEDERVRDGGSMNTIRIRLGTCALLAVASFSLVIAGFADTMEVPEDEREVDWQACQRWHAHASSQVERVRAAHRACATDSDCVMVDTSTDCGGTCGEVIHRAGVQPMRRVISNLNATVCREHRRMGCPYGTPACLASRAVCARGECTFTPL